MILLDTNVVVAFLNGDKSALRRIHAIPVSGVLDGEMVSDSTLTNGGIAPQCDAESKPCSVAR